MEKLLRPLKREIVKGDNLLKSIIIVDHYGEGINALD